MMLIALFVNGYIKRGSALESIITCIKNDISFAIFHIITSVMEKIFGSKYPREVQSPPRMYSITYYKSTTNILRKLDMSAKYEINKIKQNLVI